MVVLLHSYGQRSNNLFQHVNIDSYCRENGIYFYNKHIQDMQQDYPNVGSKNVLVEILLACKVPQVLNRLKLITYVDFLEEEQLEEYRKQLSTHKFVSCNGWWFWNSELIVKYRNHYKTIFKPNVDENYLYSMFLNRQSPDEKLVGVHIRRGDFLQHEGGKYFYSDSVYLDKIHHINEQLSNNCRIIIFSNDINLNKEVYQRNFDNLLFSDRSVIEDHYLMSQCDYLIGPPSTFTLWGSYMGEVPFLHLYDANQEALLHTFAAV